MIFHGLEAGVAHEAPEDVNGMERFAAQIEVQSSQAVPGKKSMLKLS